MVNSHKTNKHINSPASISPAVNVLIYSSVYLLISATLPDPDDLPQYP